MTDNDFRAACDVLVVRWRFDQMVEREFEQSDVPTGLAATESPEVRLLAASGDLLAPRDTASTDQGRGGSETGDL